MTLVKDKLFTIILTIACIITVTACSNETGKPESSNRPYEVLLIGDKKNIVYNELTDAIAGLSQPEPSFDVTVSNDSMPDKWQKLMRSIVIIRFKESAGKTKIEYKRNVYARPQIILTVTAASPSVLREYMKEHPGCIRNILNAFELGNELRTLKSQHNEKAEKTIKQMFGIDMLIPAEMQASKRGKDFLWLSNNANEGLMNICVYRIRNGAGSTINTSKKSDKTKRFCYVRDSIMKINIPGEHEGMYMETTSAHWNKRPLFFLSKGAEATSEYASFYGQWDMHNDAMGGPYVAKGIVNYPHIIYIEGFVYAPESKKRNKIKRLEVYLYTARATSGRQE